MRSMSASARAASSSTGIECPSARLTEMRKKGVNIFSIGQKKYEGSRAFEMYAVTDMKPRYRYFERGGVMVEVRVPNSPAPQA